MDYLPGTTVEVNQNNTAQGFLDSAFAIGGLVLSQVVQLTGLEPHTVQNWVKRKFISPPVAKKYDMNQFCRIAVINMLKDIFQIERIIGMLDYAEGREADNVLLYITFSEVLEATPADAIGAQTNLDRIIGSVVRRKGLSPAAAARMQKVVKIMVLAYISARVRQNADQHLLELEKE